MTEKDYWNLRSDISWICYEMWLNGDRLEKVLAKHWFRPEKCCDKPDIVTWHNKTSALWNPDMNHDKQEYVTIYFEWCQNCGKCTWINI